MPTWGQIRNALGETYRQVDEATGGYLPYGAEPRQLEPAAPDLGGGFTRPEAKAQEYLKDKIEKVKRSSLEESDKPTPLVHPPFITPDAVVDGWRKVGDTLSSHPAGKAVVHYIKEIPEQGVIPVPTMNQEGHKNTIFVKSLAGPLGKPFKVLSNDDTDGYLQETVDKSVRTKDGGYWNEDAGQSYHDLKSKPGNMVFGKYNYTDDNGTARVTDEWDTNRSVGWHADQVINNPSIGSKINSVGAGLHRVLDDIGWTNNFPIGKNYPAGVVR